VRGRRERGALLSAPFAATLLWLIPCGVAMATSSLSFEGGGYAIDLEIGDDARPVIAAVHFHAPGDAQGVVLAHDAWRVIAFEPRQQRLLLRYDGAAAVPAFSLSVQHDDAVLVIDGRRVRAAFDWGG